MKYLKTIAIKKYFSPLMFLVMTTVASGAEATKQFHLQKGDLLFQDLNCGDICNSIDSVTYGYKNTYVSHVAMVVDDGVKPQVIEAVSRGVVITPLSEFLNRSLDKNKHPRVMVGRLNPSYQTLTLLAISMAKRQLGKPYNATFVPANGKAFYCSELIDYAYRKINHNRAVFQQHPMDFTNKKTSQILPMWQDYYQQLHAQIPQWIPGSNPGEMSRESNITIVYFYGKLRQHK